MKRLFTLVFITLFSLSINAQTSLSLGDIAFIDYNADGTDRFGFVCLVDITASTVISFNENGWFDTGGFRSGENSIIVTLTSALECGDQVYVSASGSVENQVGTSIGSYTGSALALAGSGDQIFAYQGSAPADNTPGELSKFVAAIQMNCSGCDTNNWDGDATSSNTSAKPSVFIAAGAGTNTTYFPSEADNAQYDCSTTGNDPTTIADAVYTQGNWDTSNSSQFSVLNCNFSCAILPVELVEFKGQKRNGSVELTWKTESEVNNLGFAIQRSQNGKEWDDVNFVDGFGTTARRQSYSYVDQSISSGMHYYRLKQIDFDGGFEFSNIIVIRNDNVRNNAYPSIFPNPTDHGDGYFTFLLPDSDAYQGTVSVFSQSGKLVKQVSIEAASTRFDVSELSSGLYIVHAVYGGNVWKEKIIIQ